ncbi:MAG: hypothetical protein AAFQ82_00855 [Myxococcota bacterium]
MADAELFSIKGDGTDRQKINGELMTGGGVRGPVWSPNSAFIAYRADQNTDSVFELLANAAEGGQNVQLNDASAEVDSFFWSRDSALVGYVSDTNGERGGELYVVSPTGSARRKISGEIEDINPVFVW